MKTESLRKSEVNQSVNRRSAKEAATQMPSTSSLNVQSSANMVSEEDVFARLVDDEITRTIGADAHEKFQALVDKQLKIRTRDDGTVNMEKVIKGALKWASNEKNGVFSRNEAQKIYSNSFHASQLDSDTEVLDDRSVSSATLESDSAFAKARVALEKIISGQLALPERDLAERATASSSSILRQGYLKSLTRNQTPVQDLKDILIESSEDFQI